VEKGGEEESIPKKPRKIEFLKMISLDYIALY